MVASMTPPSGPGLGELIGLGLSAAVFVALGVGGGYWIGQDTGAGVLSTFIGLALGVVVALVVTYRRIRRYL
jgi:hypothetical protein